MQLKKNLIKILSVVLVVGLVGWLLVMRCSEKNAKDNSDALENNDSRIPVRVTVIKPQRIEWGLNVVGIIMPDKGVDILAEVGGKVKNIYFNIGDYVQKDRILIKLDDEYKRYDLIRTEAQYKSARVDLKQSELDLQRYKRLLEESGVSQLDYENVKLKRDVSEANFLTAESMYKTAKRQLADTEIKAPFGGFISQKMVEVGNMAAVGTPAARIIDIQMVKLSVEVADRDIIYIKNGDKVRIKIDAYPEIEFTGKVTAISPEADMKTKTFPVEIKSKNTDDYKLKPGMVAKGKIIIEVSENTFLLPQDVILEKDEIRYVFLNEGDSAVKKIVEIGRTYYNRVEIKSGLNIDDKVIVSGGEFLSDGAGIQVQRGDDINAMEK